MNHHLGELFQDPHAIETIGNKLPYLFAIAEIENRRGGKTNMAVGNTREQILVALLIWRFGESNVDANVPTTSSEVDVRLFSQPISIKTITDNGGIKVSWTVDAESALEFIQAYSPTCDMILAQMKWDLSPEKLKKGEHPGGLFYIPLEVQWRHLNELGVDKYLRLLKSGTNPRGIEFTKDAMNRLKSDEDTLSIPIQWKKQQIDYNPYTRWVDLWGEPP